MSVPQDSLNAWRIACDSLRGLLKGLRADIVTGRREEARKRWQEVDDAARVLGLQIERAGAERPTYKPPRQVTPLHLLDTPANRRYMAALREAWQAGQDVDRERYGDGIGTDGAAQVIEMVLRDVEQEVLGSVGTRG